MDVIEIGSSDSDDDFEFEDDEFDPSVDTDTGERQSLSLFGSSREGLGTKAYGSHDYAGESQMPVGRNSFTGSASDGSFKNQLVKRTLASSFQSRMSVVPHKSPTHNTSQKLILDADRRSKSTSYAQDTWGRHEKPKLDASKRVFPSSFSTYTFNNGGFTSDPYANASRLTSYNGDTKPKFPRPSFDGTYAASTSDRFESTRLTNEKIYGMPNSSADRRDDFYAHGTPGTSRVLPSSMLHGKYNNLQKSGFNDAEKHWGHGEDKGTEHHERHIFQQALQNLNQPKTEDDLPDGLLAVPLLKHQKIGLAWMVKKEQSAVCAGGILADDQGLGKTISMMALIQKQKPEQLRYASGDSNNKQLEALNIDDDDEEEGLNQQNEKKMPTEADDTKHNIVEYISNSVQLEEKKMATRSDSTEHAIASTSNRSLDSSRPAGGTLVVCPASVLRQWARELDEKIPEGGKLSALVYHGGSRTKHPRDLTKYDVVLTTYAIVVNEVPKHSNADDGDMDQKNADRYGLAPDFSAKNKRKQNNNDRKKQKKKCKGLDDSDLGISGGALARVRWFRVILDEAQTIKNHRTLVARACSSLRAKRRWCLSGTPIQNSIDDLFSYFRFLKLEPYDDYGQFSMLIKNPISRDPVNGYKKLQAVLKTMLLRRTKGTLIDGKPILNLPPKSINLEKIEFAQEEREFYLRLEADTREQFKAFEDAGTVQQNYASILLLILRLRQACDHPFLVNNRAHSDTISKESLSMAKQLPKDMLINLLNQLEGSFSLCVRCSDPPEDAVVSMCGHVFCYQCVSDRLTGEDNSCPSPGCREALGADLVFSKSSLRSCIFDNFNNNASTSSSALNEEHLVTSSCYISSKLKLQLMS